MSHPLAPRKPQRYGHRQEDESAEEPARADDAPHSVFIAVLELGEHGDLGFDNDVQISSATGRMKMVTAPCGQTGHAELSEHLRLSALVERLRQQRRDLNHRRLV